MPGSIGGFQSKAKPVTVPKPQPAAPAVPAKKAASPPKAKPAAAAVAASEPEAVAEKKEKRSPVLSPKASPPKKRRLSEIKLAPAANGSPCENAKIDDLVEAKKAEGGAAEGPKKKSSPPKKAASKAKADGGRAKKAKKDEDELQQQQLEQPATKAAATKAGSPKKAKKVSKKEGAKDSCTSDTETADSAETKSANADALTPLKEPGSVRSKAKAKGVRSKKSRTPTRKKKLEFFSSSLQEEEKAGKAAVAPATMAPQPESRPPPAVASTPTPRGKGRKPRLGRVRQKSTKRGEVIEIGTVRFEKGWFNNGYIFPEGFFAKTPFRSSVQFDQLVLHECRIVGKEGEFWPAPTFQIVTPDRPDEVFSAKSPTGCWNAILKRINSELTRRRAEGEDLPPPPKTAIAGPEYFGLNQPDVMAKIEEQDPDHKCVAYWAGKMDREEWIATGQVAQPRVQQRAKSSSSRSYRPKSSSGRKGKKRRSQWSDSELDDDEYADIEESYGKNRWNSVNRSERYKNRCVDRGDKNVEEEQNADNPLPGFTDPITLEPVVNPAISPYGHVMGIATWRAVLDEQGKCPFTKKELSIMNIKKLTKTNIDQFRDRIVDLAT